jgi:SAM-dependent methyltransferase
MTSEADQVIQLYERHALEWDADRGGRIGQEKSWLDQFASLLAPGARVLDIGCGSGQPIARYLIDRGFDVTGVDASPTLISFCHHRFPDRPFLVADMRTLDLQQRFDALIAWDSFFHLARDDQRRMFPVFAKHAAPGAALLFTSGPADGEAIGAYRGEPLYHASLSTGEYQDLLGANGFEVVAHKADDPGCGNHTVWLARRIGERPPADEDFP